MTEAEARGSASESANPQAKRRRRPPRPSRRGRRPPPFPGNANAVALVGGKAYDLYLLDVDLPPAAPAAQQAAGAVGAVEAGALAQQAAARAARRRRARVARWRRARWRRSCELAAGRLESPLVGISSRAA